MAELIIITGGAYSGKTSLVEALAARGHAVLPEAAFEVIDALVREHGVEGQAQWREANLVEFQRRVTELQHQREVAALRSETPRVFCDRGLLDGRAYCALAGVDWPEDLAALAGPARYAHVFTLATLSAFDPRASTGRIDTRTESIRVATFLEGIYRPRSVAMTPVPEMAVEARVELVLRTVGLVS